MKMGVYWVEIHDIEFFPDLCLNEADMLCSFIPWKNTPSH